MDICALVLLVLFIDKNSTVLVLILQDRYSFLDIRTVSYVVLVLPLLEVVAVQDLITEFFLYTILVLSEFCDFLLLKLFQQTIIGIRNS